MNFEDWGEISYEESTKKQLQLVEAVASTQKPDTVIFCTHPPVVTLGRSTMPEDVGEWSGDIVETSRGGRATYHGPEQLVIYPIINLSKTRKNLRSKDVHQYLRLLEKTIVDGLKTIGIESQVKETKSQDTEGREIIYTGVWVGDKKIASLGIAVRKWVTYHGAAINLFSSETAFRGIQPCGFSTETMTNVESILGQRRDPVVLAKVFHPLFSTIFVE